MTLRSSLVLAAALSMSASLAGAQTPAAAPAFTDVYYVQFAKALPGQAAAVEKNLKELNPKDPMASHYILLRHQQGADWDYCLIQHLGPKTTIEITPPPAPATPPTGAWHEDNYVAGPSWAEFQKAMDFNGKGNSVFVVAVHRPAPGHRTQLQDVLSRPDPASKAAGALVLAHVQGGAWTFMTLDRYSSWQEFAAERAAATSGKGWFEVREHSSFHIDTIADRVR